MASGIETSIHILEDAALHASNNLKIAACLYPNTVKARTEELTNIITQLERLKSLNH